MKYLLKHISFIVFTLYLTTICSSQNNRIDSLLNVLENGKADSNTVNTLNNLSLEFFNAEEYEKSLQYAENAISLSRKVKYKKGEAIALYNAGRADMELMEFSASAENYFKALAFYKEMDDPKGMAEVNQELGSFCLRIGNYTRAINYLKDCIPYYESKEIATGKLYFELSEAYSGAGKFDEALKNISTALGSFKNTHDKFRQFGCYKRIGDIYFSQKKYQNALNNYFVALDLEQEPENKKGETECYSALGKTYLALHKYKDATENFELALALQEEIGDLKGKTFSNAYLGHLYNLRKKKNGARLFLKEALRLSRQYENTEALSLTYLYLSRNDSIRKEKNSAEENYGLYLTFKDSLALQEKRARDQQGKMKALFEELFLADSLNTIERKKAAVQTKLITTPHIPFLYIAIGGGIILVIVSLIVYLIVRKRKKITPP